MIEMNEAEALSQEIVTAQIARVARRGAKVLQISAVVLAVGAVINGWIYAATDQNQFYGGSPSVEYPLWWKVQLFLSTALVGLAWAALILAAGFAIEIVALRATRVPTASELPPHTSPPSAPAPGPTDFAARPTPAAAAISVTPSAQTPPPPMKIANDEIWRR